MQMYTYSCTHSQCREGNGVPRPDVHQREAWWQCRGALEHVLLVESSCSLCVCIYMYVCRGTCCCCCYCSCCYFSVWEPHQNLMPPPPVCTRHTLLHVMWMSLHGCSHVFAVCSALSVFSVGTCHSLSVARCASHPPTPTHTHNASLAQTHRDWSVPA